MGMFQVLAIQLEAAQSTTIFWCSVILAVSVVGFLGIMVFKRIWRRNEAPSESAGFSLSDLREMRDRGEITPEEYEQTRANVIAKVKQRAAQSKPKPKPTDNENPTDLAG